MSQKWDYNLKIYVLNGILYSIMFNLYAPFSVKFLERLGGTELHISLFNALPGLTAVFAIIPGSLLVARCVHKKKMTCLFFFISRIFLFILALVPLLPDSLKPMIFVLLISLRNFPDSISQSALQSFSGDLFAPDERAAAISLRSKFSIPATLVVTILSGQILSRLPSTDAQRIFIYQMLFILAFVIGIVEVLVFMRIKEPESGCTENIGMKKIIFNIMADKKFRSFMAPSLFFYFSWQMGWPLFNIYQIIHLGADEWWLSLISVVSSIGMYAGFGFWGRMIRQKGNRWVMCATALGMAANPIIMMASPNLPMITLVNLIIGFFTAGTQTVLLSYLLEVTPDENRTAYIGVYNTFVNISLAISPLAAHAVLSHSNIFFALGFVALLRFAAGMVFIIQGRQSFTASA